jgi:hypothetical protein
MKTLSTLSLLLLLAGCGPLTGSRGVLYGARRATEAKTIGIVKRSVNLKTSVYDHLADSALVATLVEEIRKEGSFQVVCLLDTAEKARLHFTVGKEKTSLFFDKEYMENQGIDALLVAERMLYSTRKKRTDSQVRLSLLDARDGAAIMTSRFSTREQTYSIVTAELPRTMQIAAREALKALTQNLSTYR